MVSRTAIGLIWGTAAWLGTSDFAAFAGVGFGEVAFDFAAPPGWVVLAELTAGLLLAVPSGGFEPGAAPVEAFAADLVAGLAAAVELPADLDVAFVEAGAAGELGPGVFVSLVAVGVGLIAGFGGTAGFGICPPFGAVAWADGWLGAMGLVAAGLGATG